MSQAGVVNDAALVLPGDVATTFVTSSGTAQPSGNILNVLGATGTGNTVDIFAPNTIVHLYDDFITNNFNLTTIGQLIWASSGFTRDVNGTAAHPGLVKVVDGTASSLSLFDVSGVTGPFIVGGGAISVNWVFSLVTLSEVANRYVISAGMSNTDQTTVGTNGIYFSYSDNVNSGNWVLNCTSGGVTTSVNTSTAAVTGYVNLGFVVNAAGTRVNFTINGASVGTAITTNIPSTVIGPMIFFARSSGTLPSSLVDLFYLEQVLTTPR